MTSGEADPVARQRTHVRLPWRRAEAQVEAGVRARRPAAACPGRVGRLAGGARAPGPRDGPVPGPSAARPGHRRGLRGGATDADPGTRRGVRHRRPHRRPGVAGGGRCSGAGPGPERRTEGGGGRTAARYHRAARRRAPDRARAAAPAVAGRRRPTGHAARPGAARGPVVGGGSAGTQASGRRAPPPAATGQVRPGLARHAGRPARRRAAQRRVHVAGDAGDARGRRPAALLRRRPEQRRGPRDRGAGGCLRDRHGRPRAAEPGSGRLRQRLQDPGNADTVARRRLACGRCRAWRSTGTT